MNKVLIRNRQIDNNKQLPILIRDNDDLSDLNDYSNINRGSQILSGMDKGEESEHHFQEALRELDDEKTIVNRAIPIPDVTDDRDYNSTYESSFKLPKQYIRVKILDLENELPEYDMDQEDENWLEKSKLDITRLKFEQIVEHFERASTQKTLLLDEAKSLLRSEPANVITGVYDYWLSKRVKVGQPLILSVKADRGTERSNNAPIDPYVAFRKRSEKMTTRKNRRVDETSYEKMYRLRIQMEKLSEIIQLISKREAIKCEKIRNEREVYRKRFEYKDYDKGQLKETESLIKRQSLKLSENFKSAQRSREENQKENKRKRPYSKALDIYNNPNVNISDHIRSSDEDEDFTFKPMVKCKYIPSRWSITDYKLQNHQNQSQLRTQSLNTIHNSTNLSDNHNNNPSQFSSSNLCHLSDTNLRNLNVPIRYRMRRDKKISIDLQQLPDTLSDSNWSLSYLQTQLQRKYKPPSKCTLTEMINRIKYLAPYDIYSGLRPLNIPYTVPPDNINESCANKSIPFENKAKDHCSTDSNPRISHSSSSDSPDKHCNSSSTTTTTSNKILLSQSNHNKSTYFTNSNHSSQHGKANQILYNNHQHQLNTNINSNISDISQTPIKSEAVISNSNSLTSNDNSTYHLSSIPIDSASSIVHQYAFNNSSNTNSYYPQQNFNQKDYHPDFQSNHSLSYRNGHKIHNSSPISVGFISNNINQTNNSDNKRTPSKKYELDLQNNQTIDGKIHCNSSSGNTLNTSIYHLKNLNDCEAPSNVLSDNFLRQNHQNGHCHTNMNNGITPNTFNNSTQLDSVNSTSISNKHSTTSSSINNNNNNLSLIHHNSLLHHHHNHHHHHHHHISTHSNLISSSHHLSVAASTSTLNKI